MAPAAALAAHALACERGDRLLFEGLSFAVEAGSALQVTGPNGAGKTTLLRVLCGLVLPTDGQVTWRGTAIDRSRTVLLSELCYLGYAGGVKLELTPRENLGFLRALQTHRSTLGIEDALERVGLYGFEDVPAYTLSAGQRRRVSLARLLLSAAPLWILDEPLTALDGAGVALAEGLLGEQIAGGGVVVFTTHQPLTRPPPHTATLELD